MVQVNKKQASCPTETCDNNDHASSFQEAFGSDSFDPDSEKVDNGGACTASLDLIASSTCLSLLMSVPICPSYFSHLLCGRFINY